MKIFSLSIQTEIILYLALRENNVKLVRHRTESKQVEQPNVYTQSKQLTIILSSHNPLLFTNEIDVKLQSTEKAQCTSDLGTSLTTHLAGINY